jgi:hypothetical protein
MLLILIALSLASALMASKVDLWGTVNNGCSTSPLLSMWTSMPAGCNDVSCAVVRGEQIRLKCSAATTAPAGMVFVSMFEGTGCVDAAWKTSVAVLPSKCVAFGELLANLMGGSRQERDVATAGQSALSALMPGRTSPVLTMPAGVMVSCIGSQATVKVFAEATCQNEVQAGAMPPLAAGSCGAITETGLNHMLIVCPSGSTDGGTILGFPQQTAIIIGAIIGGVLLAVGLTVGFVIWRRRRNQNPAYIGPTATMPSVTGFETTEDREADILDDNDF